MNTIKPVGLVSFAQSQ